MKAFKELGQKVDSLWRKYNYQIGAFSAVTEEVLQTVTWTNVNIIDICNWVFHSKDFVNQVNIDSKFGQPPLTVFATDKFYIEVLFWLSGTTSIHQHGFTGAFCVLSGSSIHTTYRFTAQHCVNQHLMFGDIQVTGTELLEKGQYRKIPGGNSFIHSLFHLEFPSISLVIRTYKDPANPIQYNYYNPHIAINDFHKDARTSRQLQMLRMLRTSGNSQFTSFLNDFARNADAHAYLSVLIPLTFESLITADEREIVLHIFEGRNPDLIRFIRPIFAELERVRIVGDGRRFVTDSTHRFFMAMLMNASDREHLDRIVRGKYPNEDPAKQIFRWIQELNQSGKFNAKFDEFQLDLLELMIKRQSFEEAIENLKAFYDEKDIETRRDEIRELYLKIENMPLLRVLFKLPVADHTI